MQTPRASARHHRERHGAAHPLERPRASAQESPISTQRWAIELFYRWVKQTLKITHFVGTSEKPSHPDAVALIAFLLLRLAQAFQKAIPSPTIFTKLIRANLMHRRSIDNLLHHRLQSKISDR